MDRESGSFTESILKIPMASFFVWQSEHLTQPKSPRHQVLHVPAFFLPVNSEWSRMVRPHFLSSTFVEKAASRVVGASGGEHSNRAVRDISTEGTSGFIWGSPLFQQ